MLKRCLFLSILFIVVIIVISIMIKYDVEGEKTMPFSISKILLVSTVDGDKVDDENNIWNINVTQVNDVYLYIDKTSTGDETIKEIRLENFNVIKQPQKGNVKLLRPTGELSNLYSQSKQDYLSNGIIYTGGVIDDLKSLEISNDGGILGFRLALTDLGSYISNENTEITYDGRLFSNIGANLDEVKFEISFDIIIKTSEDIDFKGTLNLSMPSGDFIENGSSSVEITNFDNVIFKRI